MPCPEVIQSAEEAAQDAIDEELGDSDESCNSGQTDEGKGAVALLLQLAAIAVAGINTAAAIEMAMKQYDIANRYLNISKWWRNFYNTAYKPVEDQELEEARNLKLPKAIYDTARGRAKTYARIEAKGDAENAMMCTSEYCTGLRAALLKDEIEKEMAMAVALDQLGYRNERAYLEARDDVIWRRKYNTVKRGRDLLAETINFGQLSFGIFGDLGRAAGQAAGGAMRFLGYARERRETQYPGLWTQFNSPTVLERRTAAVDRPPEYLHSGQRLNSDEPPEYLHSGGRVRS